MFARFVFTTGDAMGMNMVNIAVDQVCRHAVEMTGCEGFYLRCNYSSDKKPAAINLFRTYGKEVAIDCTLPADVVQTNLASQVASWSPLSAPLGSARCKQLRSA